jgi:hypothetical protein
MHIPAAANDNFDCFVDIDEDCDCDLFGFLDNMASSYSQLTEDEFEDVIEALFPTKTRVPA